MIRKIFLEGVRTHERTEILLERLTCLVGPNGSGKSTVLDAFQAINGNLPGSWVRAGSSEWQVLCSGSNGAESAFVVRQANERRRFDRLGLVPLHFRLDSSVLRAASVFKDAQPTLGSEGSQLSAVLASWKLADSARFDAVVEQLRQVVPFLRDLRPLPSKVKDLPAFELLFDFRSAPGVPASAVSEGTLLALGLLTAIHQKLTPTPSQQSVVLLLDDIDRGLHPDAQVELIKLLRQLAELKDIQIVMTTHSPYIIDALAPEEVCVLALDATGTTRARQLSEIPGAEKYRGMLSTGELWSSHGESWVLEEQTKSALS